MITFSWPVLLFMGELLVKLLMIGVLLLQRRKPAATKLAWIMLIIVIPFVGTLLYLLVGTTRLGSKRRKRHKRILKLVPQSVASHIEDPKIKVATVDPAFHSIACIAETVGASYVVGHNHARLFGDSDKLIHALTVDIDGSQHHCHILSYIMLDDEAGRQVANALIQAVKRGVVCRLLLDDMGSKEFLQTQTCASLKASGVKVIAALPANILRAAFERMDLRNHRKITVIDNKIGYMGSQNIAESSFAPWSIRPSLV